MKKTSIFLLIFCAFVSSIVFFHPVSVTYATTVPVQASTYNWSRQSSYGANVTGNWTYRTGNWVMSSPAIGSDGTIYVGSADNKIYAINANGTLKWSYTTGMAVISSPTIGSDGTIYIGSNDGKLYALNPDGTLKWSYSNGDSVTASPAIGADGSIYIGIGTKLYALNPDGTLKWSYTTGNQIESSATIGLDGTIYIGSNDNKIYAINSDGTLKWSYATGSLITSSPGIGLDGTIYVGSFDKKIYALNPDGTLKWSYATGNSIKSSPVIGSDGSIYVGSTDCYLYAFNADGTLKWKYGSSKSISSTPAISTNGTIYVGSESSFLYAINPDGRLINSYITGGGIQSSPIIGSNGIIYVGSNDYKLYAIDSNIMTSISINSDNITTLSPGESISLTVLGNSLSNNQPLTDGVIYNSSNPDVVTVNSEGKITGLRYGGSVVNVTYGSLTDSIAVNVNSVIWKYNTGDTIRSSPVIGSDGNIYIAGYNKLYNINSDRSLKWSYTTEDYIGSSPAIGSDGTIYLQTSYKLYAINSSGTLKWSYSTVSMVKSSPIIGSDGNIYLVTNNALYNINSDGTLNWTYRTNDYFATSPAIGSDGTIYLGAGKLYAINSDGTLKWSYTTEGFIGSSPVIGSDGNIYLVSGNKLYDINLDGTLKWSCTAEDYLVYSPAIGSDGTIYVGSSFKLYAIDPKGTLKWSYTAEDYISSSPIIGSDGNIYITGYNKLYNINPDRTLKWTFLLEMSSQFSPVIGSDGTIYFAADSSYLFAIVGDQKKLQKITLDVDSTLKAGETSQSIVTAVYSDSSTNDVTGYATFTSSNTTVASIDGNGLVTAISKGQTVISAVYGDQSATKTITVNDIDVSVPTLSFITLNVDTSLNIGETNQSVVTGVYSDNNTSDVTVYASFTSSNTAVASISDDGLVTAISKGQTVITAVYGGQSATKTITVSAKTSSSGHSSSSSVNNINNLIKVIIDGQIDNEIDVSSIMTKNNTYIIKTNSTGNIVKVELNADTFNILFGENPEQILALETENTSYNLPLKAVNINNIENELGTSAKDIKIAIIMQKVEDSEVADATALLNSNGAKVITKPINFKIEVFSSNGKTKKLNNLGMYVDRTIKLPNTTDDSNITGVMYDSDNAKYIFVPSTFEVSNGNIIATLKRYGNSIYSIIQYSKTFDDISNHWAKQYIDELASKLIVNGDTSNHFNPDSNITRAEFLSMIVRSLGIPEEKNSTAFSDANNEWYTGYIAAAIKLGIVNGYEDGTFKPNNSITREEMACIISNALKFAGATEDITNPEQYISKFKDASDISIWAKKNIGVVAKYGIIQGNLQKEFAPKSYATRAEAATMLEKTLKFLKFIN